jgi:hypothetical protein
MIAFSLSVLYPAGSPMMRSLREADKNLRSISAQNDEL